jgi:DNA-binding CsgD family transcriptional regulator
MLPTEDVIDRIYETAALPNGWRALLDGLSRSLGCAGSIIFSTRVGGAEWMASDGAQSFMEQYVEQGWMLTNERIQPVADASYPWFVTDTDFTPEEELAQKPVYRDFLIPRGWHAAAGTIIQGAHDDLIALTFEGFPSHAAARAALPALNAMRAHLARALSLTSQFHLAREQAMISGLSTIGAAAALVDNQGRLRSFNAAFERLAGTLLFEGKTRLRIGNARSDALLTDALSQPGSRAAASRSIVLRPAEGGAPAVLHVIPQRLDAREVFSSSGFLLLLATRDNNMAPRADLLRLLFDLTPAEARLSLALVHGHDLAGAAASMRITYATARTHLKAVFAKTGVTRQAELVRLVSGYVIPA